MSGNVQRPLWWRLVFSAPVMISAGAIALMMAVSYKEAHDETARREAAKITAEQTAGRIAADAKSQRDAVSRLSVGSDATALGDCRSVLGMVTLPDGARAECRDAFAREATRLAETADMAGARAALSSALVYGLSEKEIARIRHVIVTAESRKASVAAIQARKDEARQAKIDAIERRAYGAILRNRFLDLGADVKVDVSGAKGDHITLRWVLFNDVWAHRMTKPDGIMSDMRRLHFRRVDMEDGYHYHVYWDLDE